jgi:hypothetical protein
MKKQTNELSPSNVLTLLGYQEAKAEGESDESFFEYVYLLYCEGDIPESILKGIGLELGLEPGPDWDKLSDDEKKSVLLGITMCFSL